MNDENINPFDGDDAEVGGFLSDRDPGDEAPEDRYAHYKVDVDTAAAESVNATVAFRFGTIAEITVDDADVWEDYTLASTHPDWQSYEIKLTFDEIEALILQSALNTRLLVSDHSGFNRATATLLRKIQDALGDAADAADLNEGSRLEILQLKVAERKAREYGFDSLREMEDAVREALEDVIEEDDDGDSPSPSLN